MTDASGLKRIVRPVFGVLAVIFIAYAARSLWASWDGASVHVLPEYLIGATAAAIAAMYVQLLAWRVLIRSMTGIEMPYLPSARLYLDSQMARYTPGKIGLPAVRMSGARAVGVSPQVMGSALLIELISWTATGSLVGASVLSFFPYSAEVTRQLSQGSLFLSGASALGLTGALALNRKYLPKRLLSILGAEGTGALVPWGVPSLHFFHFVLWIVSGGLVCVSVGGDASQALMSGAILCLAIVVGFLALLAPAGAGVREAVVAAGLSPVLGAAASVAVSILGRIVSLVADVVIWAWFRLRTAKRAE